MAGGSGAIGVAIASLLGSRGYSIAVHYRAGRDRAESVVAGLPGPHPHIAVGVDLLDRGATERAVADAERALEEGRYGMRANVIAPGRVDIGDGDLTESDAAYASLDAIGALRRSLPLPTADEVAHTVAFLIGPESTAITGQVIATAGGEQW